jgi:hypothetical protein
MSQESSSSSSHDDDNVNNNNDVIAVNYSNDDESILTASQNQSEYHEIDKEVSVLANEVERISLSGNSIESVDFLRSNQCLPIFAMNRKSGYSAEELVKILINPVQEKLCSSVPSSIEDSLCFLIDLNKVPFDNILCDNMGVWINNGSPKTNIRRENMSFKVVSHGTDFDYVLFRKYFKHKLNEEILRTVSFLHDKEGDLVKIALVQYVFKCGPVPVNSLKVKHGNSKDIEKTFSRTYGSTKNMISSSTCSRNKLTSQIIAENGGIENIDNPSIFPLSNKQMHYWRNKLNLNEDELLCLFEKSYSGLSSIKKLEFYPELRVVLLNEQHKTDLKRFCVDDGGSVLGVDTTFNIGDYLVTLTTYRHMLLIDSKTGESPVMIGPAYIHQTKSKVSFYYFSSTLGLHNKAYIFNTNI